MIGENCLMPSSLLPELDQIRWIKSLNEQKMLRYSASICTSAFNDLSSIPCRVLNTIHHHHHHHHIHIHLELEGYSCQ